MPREKRSPAESSVGSPEEKPKRTSRPPGAEQLQRAAAEGAADAVEGHRDLAPVERLADRVAPAGRGVVDGDRRLQLRHALHLGRAAGDADNGRAGVAGRLHEQAAQAARGRRDEDDVLCRGLLRPRGSRARCAPCRSSPPQRRRPGRRAARAGRRSRARPARRSRRSPARDARPPAGPATARRPAGRRRRPCPRPRGPGSWAGRAAPAGPSPGRRAGRCRSGAPRRPPRRCAPAPVPVADRRPPRSSGWPAGPKACRRMACMTLHATPARARPPRAIGPRTSGELRARAARRDPARRGPAQRQGVAHADDRVGMCGAHGQPRVERSSPPGPFVLRCATTGHDSAGRVCPGQKSATRATPTLMPSAWTQ